MDSVEGSQGSLMVIVLFRLLMAEFGAPLKSKTGESHVPAFACGLAAPTHSPWRRHPFRIQKLSGGALHLAELLRDWYAATYPERLAGHLQSGGGLAAFVFVQINQPHHPSHRRFVKTGGHDFSGRFALHHVSLQN